MNILSSFRKCLPWLALSCALTCRAEAVAPYQIVSGDLPPMTVELGADAPGALGQIAQELSARLGHPQEIRFYPWARAVAMAQSLPRTAVLPLTRTPERESQFRWLVKLYRQNFVFVAHSHPGFDLNSLASLQQRKVVVLRSSPNLKQLRQRKFQHIVEANNVEDMVRMFKRNIVDVIYGSEVIIQHTLLSAGFKPGELEVGMTLESGDIWLGGSPDFTDADSAAWQEAMVGLVRDGSYRRILRQYRLPE